MSSTLPGLRMRASLRAASATIAICGGCGGPGIPGTGSPPRGDAAAEGALAMMDAASDSWLSEVGGDGGDASASMGASDGEIAPAHCAGSYGCAPAVPDGWTGPLALRTGPTGASPPSDPACGEHFVGPMFQGMNGPTAVPAACVCQCEAATDVRCAAPTLAFYKNIACPETGGCGCAADRHCADVMLTANACQTYDVTGVCGAVTSVVLIDPTPDGGSCAPLATSAIAPITWANLVTACASALGLAASDCPSGSVCAPFPQSPFETHLCIAQTGDVDCSAPGYPQRRLFYGSIDDSRACAPCTCAAPAGSTCTATLSLSQDPNCADTQVEDGGSADCLQGPPSGSAALGVQVAQGTCTPSVAAPIGTISPADPTTFCCEP